MNNWDDLEELEELDELEESSEIRQSPMDMIKETNVPDHLIPPNWIKSAAPFQPLFLCDSHLSLLWYNPALVELFGIKELKDVHNLSQLLNLAQGDSLYQELLLSVKKRDSNFHFHRTVNVVIPQRGVCHLILMLLPILNEKELPSHYWGIIEDHTENQRDLVFKTFQSLLEASILKDNDTGQHVKRVNGYSRYLARCIKEDSGSKIVNSNYIEDISYLAAMHDVGKIGTPDDILNKEGPLEDWEMGIMKEHTTNGAFILSNYPNPMAKDIALNHHERWDGSGYPYGKIGEMIPLSARIVALADVYDALRSKRSYKDSWSHEKSCSIIIESAGTHFDPYIVDLFQLNHKKMDSIWNDLKDE